MMAKWFRIVNRPSAGCLATLSIAWCFVSIGCSDRLRTYPVSGTVRFKSGGAVHVGTVELKSREHRVQARGQIQSDGSFTLTTYKDADGAVAGMHDCVVVQLVVAEGIKGHKPSSIGVVAQRYANYSTSGLTAEISPDKKNELVLEVEGILKAQPKDHSH
jgi:hypothetical protein